MEAVYHNVPADWQDSLLSNASEDAEALIMRDHLCQFVAVISPGSNDQ